MSTNDVIALAIIDFWQLPTAATSLGMNMTLFGYLILLHFWQ